MATTVSTSTGVALTGAGADALSDMLEASGFAVVAADAAQLLVARTALSGGFDARPLTNPGRRLIILAPPAGPRAVRKALENGVDGVVWDEHAQARLVPAIHAVLAGQLVIPREAWRPSEEQELTNREKQVLALVIMGLTNGEIATKLYLTESTVKSHLATAFRKLGVRSRAEAARVITDPNGGLGTGILKITPTSSSGRSSARAQGMSGG